MIAWSYVVEVIGVDGLILHELKIHIHHDNALSVEGAIGDEKLANDILDNASDAIRGYHQRKGGLVVPGKDVSIQGKEVRQVNVVGPIEDRAYALDVMKHAKAAIKDMHARRALSKPSEQGTKIEI
jgi:hypothetical protein